MISIAIPPRILAGDFAGWLRDAMAARRLSTRGLAARSGIDHSSICRLARGEREPSLATAVAILKVLGTEPMRYAISTGNPPTVDEVRPTAIPVMPEPTHISSN
jgi:transcriptional regulator with XRE-family HTH domain